MLPPAWGNVGGLTWGDPHAIYPILPVGDNGCNLRPFCLGITFAERLEQLQYIIMPERCRGQETLGASTIHLHDNFPVPEQRTLYNLGRKTGFLTYQHVDENGKNILHHMFTGMKENKYFQTLATYTTHATPFCCARMFVAILAR